MKEGDPINKPEHVGDKILFISLTSRVIASILKTLQAFEEDFKDLTASPRHMVVEIGKDSYKEGNKGHDLLVCVL